jgi:MFS family permease
MMTGTTLGDLLCPSQRPQRWEIDRLFMTAAAMGTLALVFAMLATRGQVKPLKRKQPPLRWLVRRYHPGLILLMGMATGFGVGLPQIFLRPYVVELGLSGIGIFFWAYTIIAFVTRISIRRVPEKFGIRPMVVVGLCSLAMAMVMFLIVRERWQLVIPALFTGIAHALLFPAIVAGGSTAFPTRFRGLGTTLMLSTIDIGNLIGNPAVGGILTLSALAGVPRYPVMFTIVASILLSLGLYYTFATRPGAPSSAKRRPARLRMHKKHPRPNAA